MPFLFFGKKKKKSKEKEKEKEKEKKGSSSSTPTSSVSSTQPKVVPKDQKSIEISKQNVAGHSNNQTASPNAKETNKEHTNVNSDGMPEPAKLKALFDALLVFTLFFIFYFNY